MASNAARKLPKGEVVVAPDAATEIQNKKELKQKEIAKVFEEARDRVKDKGEKLDTMQAELNNLLDKIPDQEGVDFKDRLKEFVLRFDEVKQHLKALYSDAQVVEMHPKADVKTEKLKDEKEGSSKLENFRDVDNNLLNGTLDVVAIGKPVFKGSITFGKGREYSGSAIMVDGVAKFHGEGFLQENGVQKNGVFEKGAFKKGSVSELLDDGRRKVDFITDYKKESTKIGYLDSKDELDGVGEFIDYIKGLKSQGNFSHGVLVDGYVSDNLTSKVLERFKNSNKVEVGENLPSNQIGGLELVSTEQKTKDAADEVNRRMEKLAESEKISGLINFVDARGHVLNGTLVSTPDGKYFTGIIKLADESFGKSHAVYEGIARLDKKSGVFVFDDSDEATFKFSDIGGQHVQKGSFKDGEFESGTDTVFGYPSSVTTIEKGVVVEREIEVAGIKDSAGTVLTKGKKVNGRSRSYYEGKFRTLNGKTYEGKADFKGGKFDWSNESKGKGVMGKVVDIFKNAFGRKKTEPTFGSKFGLMRKEVSTKSPQDKEPEEPNEEAVVEDHEATPAQKIIDEVSKLDKLDNFSDAYGQILNGTITHTPDGKHIFEGKIEFHGEPAYQYEGKAVLNADGMFEPFNEAQAEQKPEAKVTKTEKSKEKGRLGKLADVVFSKAGAKIASETTYKTAAGILGVKLGTDLVIACVAAVLEKRAGTKDLAAKIGEYSDVHKFFVGKNEISAIKEGFAEFMETLNPEDGEDFELNIVDEKYSDLKVKIESAVQIDPEAKGKLLAKLEKIKQNFDAENKKLEDEEKDEALQHMQAYLVNKTAGMQLVRDGFNGAAKLIVVASGGAAAGAAAGAVLLAKQAAIGRVMSMATTKIIERGQKNKKFNEQMKLEEKEVVGTLQDFKFALLETMHGLTGGVFNEGRDVKTGKKLTELQRLGNFGKSIGNVLVAVGVTLGIKGETISSVIGDFMNKFQGAKGGAVHEAMMQKVAAKVPEAKGIDAGGIPDNTPVGAAIAATEAKAAAVTAGIAADHVASDKGLEVSSDAASAEHAGGNSSGEVLSIKDLSKVRGFASWEREMLKGMKYEFHGRDIHHSYRFHPGAKIEFVGADDKSIYTYTVPGGGSAAGAIEEFHDKHPELFKNKEGWSQIKGVRLIDTAAEGQRPTIEVPKNVLIESHRAGHTVFKEGGAVAKPALDKGISSDKLPSSSAGSSNLEKIKIGPNIKASLPKGWEFSSDEKGLTTVSKMTESGLTFVPIHTAEGSSGWLNIANGKMLDNGGQHIGNLDFNHANTASVPVGSSERISWSNGGNISEKDRADLVKNISHQPAEKGVATEVAAKAERVGRHGGGGAPKESAPAVPAEKPVQEAEVAVGSKVSAKAVEADPKLPAQPPVEERPAEPQPEATPVVKEITSLEDGRDAIAGLEYLDADEKMRLNNFTYLLEWQDSLYGQNGSTLRNMLEAQDAFGVLLDKTQINAMMSELAHNNESASKEFMKAVADHQPYSKIIEKLNDKMPGYSIFHDASNSGFTDRVMGTDLSQNMAENKTSFRDLEVERVKELINKAQTEKYLQTRQARNE